MKYKCVRDKKSGDLRIDYYKITDRKTFRYETLGKLLLDKEIVIRVDTNLVESEKTDMEFSKELEQGLIENNINYEVIPSEKTKTKKIFGIRLKSSRENAYNIIFKVEWNLITKEFFNKYLAKCDLDIGITPIKAFDEINKDIQKGYLTSFFDSGCFEANIYDSNYIGTMRLSNNLENPLP